MIIKFFILFLLYLIKLKMCADILLPRRLFYNIAHMVNSVGQISEYLDLGANAIEVDVQFMFEGTPLHTFHGYPCDCFRECSKATLFDDYLKFVKNLTTPGHEKYRSSFALLMLDLKLADLDEKGKRLAGEKMAKSLIKYLFKHSDPDTRIRVVLSLPYVEDEIFISGFMNKININQLENLNQFIGWDFSGNQPLDIIDNIYKKWPNKHNIWQGDGTTNCLSFMVSLQRLNQALQIRDKTGKVGFIKKIYYWTIDMNYNLRKLLRLGVDGIITNNPDRIINILKEDEFITGFKLATHEDNPWAKFDANF